MLREPRPGRPIRARRCCSSATRAGARRPCSRCSPSPTGSRACSARRRRWCGRRATWGWRPSTGCPPPNDFSRIPRYANDYSLDRSFAMPSLVIIDRPQQNGGARPRRWARSSPFQCAACAAQTPAAAAPRRSRGRAGQEAPRAEVPGRRRSATSPRARTSASTRCSSTTRSSTPTPRSRTSSSAVVYDTATKKNLTERELRELTRVAFDSLPLELAIKKVKGNGARKLAIFSDADCPFCARLENELKSIDNVTIYTFLFPIDQLHPDSARKSRMIWCAPDTVKAWDAFFASGTLPEQQGRLRQSDRRDAARSAQKLASPRRRRWSSPTAASSPARCRAQRLEAEIAQGEAEAAKLAAAKK